ncbi:MAG: hypothetical protein HQ559_14505 [Lentisphaerae bacterium]|nr:hypothetical protein [Lentisphaerota bacterium]
MKTELKHAVALAGLFFLIAGVAEAGERFGREQGRRAQKGKDGRDGFIARLVTDKKLADEIGLTNEEGRRMQNELYKIRTKLVDMHAELQKAAMEQARLLSAETIDEKAVMTAIEKTGRIRTNIAKLKIQPLLLIKRTLDPEQLSKARERMREHQKKRKRKTREDAQEGKERLGERARNDQRDRGKTGHDRRPPPPEEDIEKETEE